MDVLVLDTVGELSDVYGAATLAFVGGSLVRKGGQNPLEPARWGVPTLFGPHMENFREVAALFLENQAAVSAANDAFDNLQKATKQAVAAAEANVTTLSAVVSKPVAGTGRRAA